MKDVLPYKTGARYLFDSSHVVPAQFRTMCPRCKKLPAFQGIVKKSSGLCTLCVFVEKR